MSSPGPTLKVGDPVLVPTRLVTINFSKRNETLKGIVVTLGIGSMEPYVKVRVINPLRGWNEDLWFERKHVKHNAEF